MTGIPCQNLYVGLVCAVCVAIFSAKFKLHYGDMTDSSCLVKIISEVRPTEIYNLAAQSHVKVRQHILVFYQHRYFVF